MLNVLFILLAATSTSLQSVFCKLYCRRENGGAIIFNVEKAFAAVLCFGVLSLSKRCSLSGDTVLFGLLFGVCLCISMHCGYMALSCGDMAITSLIASYSLIIPCIYGFSVGETATVLQIVGFLLLAVSLVLSNSKSHGAAKFSIRWLIYISLTFFTNGMCSVFQKMHQTQMAGQQKNEFMLIAMLTVFVAFSVVYLLRDFKTMRFSFAGGTLGILSGIFCGSFNYFTLTLAAFSNASLLFPAISAMTIVSSFLFARFLFKEKMSKLQLCGFFLGIGAVVLLKL